jgi:hypothetical protein
LEIRLRVFLNFFEFFLKKCLENFKSVWVEAGELKYCMNMLCKLEHLNSYLDLDFLNSLKSYSEKFWNLFEKLSKNFEVRLGKSWKAEIFHEHSLLVQT